MPVVVYLNGSDFADGVPGERAEAALDALFATTVETSSALAGTTVGLEPAPLAALAIKPRAAVRGRSTSRPGSPRSVLGVSSRSWLAVTATRRPGREGFVKHPAQGRAEVGLTSEVGARDATPGTDR